MGRYGPWTPITRRQNTIGPLDPSRRHRCLQALMALEGPVRPMRAPSATTRARPPGPPAEGRPCERVPTRPAIILCAGPTTTLSSCVPHARRRDPRLPAAGEVVFLSMLRLVRGGVVPTHEQPVDLEVVAEDFVVTAALARLLVKLARRHLEWEARHANQALLNSEHAA